MSNQQPKLVQEEERCYTSVPGRRNHVSAMTMNASRQESVDIDSLTGYAPKSISSRRGQRPRPITADARRKMASMITYRGKFSTVDETSAVSIKDQEVLTK